MTETEYRAQFNEDQAVGWGFEFTARIAPCAEDETYNGAEHEPMWVINVMNNLGRYVFESGNCFDSYHFIPTNSPIRLDSDTALVGFAFAPDPKLPTLATPNGEVQFLQLVGLTQSELDWLWQDPTRTRCSELIDKMRTDNPLLITDLRRSKSYV